MPHAWEAVALCIQAVTPYAPQALDLDCSSTKARFRRGVAFSHLGRMEDAKVDLTAVAKADPKNREARTVLEVVVAALKERKGAERAMFSRAFSGPSLYAEEEARAARAASKAAEAKAAEEVTSCCAVVTPCLDRALEAATRYTRGCNPMYARLQLHVPQAATHASRLPPDVAEAATLTPP